MHLSVTGIGAFVDFLVLSFFSYRLWKNKDGENKFYYLFSRFAFYFSLFYLLFSLPIIFMPGSPRIIAQGYVIGHFFANVAFAYLSSIIMTVAFPASRKTKAVFWLFMMVGVVLNVANFHFLPSPKFSADGVVIWNQKPLMGVAIIVTSMLVFLPAAFHFMTAAFRNQKERVRYALISISFALIIAGGPLHDVANNFRMNLLADTVTTAGFVVMLFGVMFRPKKN